MVAYADLEIKLRDRGAGQCDLDLRLRLPGVDGDLRPVLSEPLAAAFDYTALGRLVGDPAQYGLELARSLFAAEPARTFYSNARASAEAKGVALRLRLAPAPDQPASPLHALRWEVLCDIKSEDLSFLGLDQNVLLSRYLSSDDWRATDTRAAGDLRALVVIAAPAPREGEDLDQVNVLEELRRAQEGLGPAIPMQALCRLPDGQAAPGVQILGLPTLAELLRRLADGYDILYLACHGKLIGGKAKIWLEDPAGQADVIPAEAEADPAVVLQPGLISRLRTLPQLPRLVVLASCESAGRGGQWATREPGVLAALGPQLATRGVPAVIAMQGDVTMETARKFVQIFFEQLGKRERGWQIDDALAVARRALFDAHRDDWWSPALFMRLESGCLNWHTPRFAGEKDQFERWRGVINAIVSGKCTPVLGPGLAEFACGLPGQIAERWARPGEGSRFPLQLPNRSGLPLVAQFLATMQDPALPAGQLLRDLGQELLERYPALLASERRPRTWAEVDRLMCEVGRYLRRADPADPYRVLARLPARVYISTTPDNLLVDALLEANRKPRVALCPWNTGVRQPDPEATLPSFVPSEHEPLVYYLFGHLQSPDSVVITEDEYFAHLTWASQDRTLGQGARVLPAVTDAWSNNGLMFLGFDLHDWAFRVMLHGMTNTDLGVPPKHPYSLAVQVDPNDKTFVDPVTARKYMETYFEKFRLGPGINVYWGSLHDFMAGLWQKRDEWLPPGWPE